VPAPHEPAHHVGPHPAESDHSELHVVVLLFMALAFARLMYVQKCFYRRDAKDAEHNDNNTEPLCRSGLARECRRPQKLFAGKPAPAADDP
jgi:hypothetical protein